VGVSKFCYPMKGSRYPTDGTFFENLSYSEQLEILKCRIILELAVALEDNFARESHLLMINDHFVGYDGTNSIFCAAVG